MKKIKYMWLIFFLPVSAFAWQWMDLWQTPDQQGRKLLQAGKAQQAAQVFKNSNWKGVSYYRSGHYDQAFKQFNASKTSDGQYNAGNAAAFREHYEEAIAAYNKAIALNSRNMDAITNREIIRKLLQQQKKQQQQNQQKKSSSNKNQKNDKNKSAQQKTSKQQTLKQNPEQKNQKDKQKQFRQDSQKQNQANNQSQKSKPQSQDENSNQLLRRLEDDPGGLLQQKFLRDYARRHGMVDNADQGAAYDFQ